MTKTETNALLIDENILKLFPIGTFWDKRTKTFKTKGDIVNFINLHTDLIYKVYPESKPESGN